ncbi:MAG: restriction endonuclease subunit S [Sulfurimonas sp.]
MKYSKENQKSRHPGLDSGSNIPKLRFPEFENDGEWREKPLNELLTIGNGKDYKHLSNGKIPVYGTGGYMLSVNDYLYDGESVCIGRKGTIDKPMFLTGKFWTVDTLFYTHSFKHCIPKYIFYNFGTINWYDYNEAGGVPSLSKTTINKINIPVPPKDDVKEQQKIADCLSSIDNLITASTKKVEALKEHKKGLMQQLFPSEGKSVPKLRFPEFKNAPKWEEKTLGDVGKVSMCKRIMKDETAETGKIPFYKIGTFGKKADAYIDIELYEDYRKKYSFPKKGDILISASGTIGRLVVYDGLPAYFQDSNIVWIDNNEELVINSFLLFFYETVKWTTSDTTIARLYNDNLRSVQILKPSIPEQQKIADCLSSIDELITASTKKVETLREHKKGLMQQLFPSAKEL